MNDWQDAVNGLLEFGGAWFTWGHAVALFRDKEVRGVYWPAFFFFALWGVWNLYYYRHLDQPLSWLGGAVLVAGNFAWIALFLVYRRRAQCES